MTRRSSVAAIGESIFDISYLVFAVCLGIFYLANQHMGYALWFALLSLVLVGGDAFHLVPRILRSFSLLSPASPLPGLGKMITSVTMTVFYVLLWHMGLAAFGISHSPVTYVIYGLAFVRIALCFFPQNGWTSSHPSFSWSVYRNLPFTVMGIAVFLLFFTRGTLNRGSFPYLSIAVALSFLFYLPVALGAHRHPKLGMLMLPKTCMYIWILLMGLA